MTPAILPLEVRDLGFSAGGKSLLRGLSFQAAPGRRIVLLGPNGAGKSLTLRLCHGLERPSAGRIVWQGPRAADAKLHQAMVFQRPILLRRSAAANIDYALKVRGVPRGERAPRIEAALAQVGVAALADRPARVLSGGERQLLALARAAALRPEILFLDEPTASLAPAAARRVEQAVAAIHAAGATIVMTTHDLGQARRLADEVLFLHDGNLVEHGSATAFFAAPQSAEARAYMKGELL
ncbi:MAG: ATP-binding cassette domain-containing protein [Alphaproteobacteria bacterium]|nr:ATP-binding cassette domain-containing protein [Alphaproteobacteria bacterium]